MYNYVEWGIRRMYLKKAICIALICLMALSFCGCDTFTADTDALLAPPQLSGEMYPIRLALDKATGGEYTLKYPSDGNRRSAVMLEDIDGDATFEAFAFYSTVEDEQSKMHINVIRFIDGEWKSVAEQSLVGGGIERVEFSDLNSDGVEEILVGWEIYGSSDLKLAVYSLDGNVLSQRMLQQYTSFICCDLDENGEEEIFVQHLDTAAGTNRAMLFVIDDSGVLQTAGCNMDTTVKTAYPPILSDLSSGQSAIYIDEVKGAGSITEVLFLEKGELVNPLLKGEGVAENTETLRPLGILSQDVNGDGILDIPVASVLANADPTSNETLYYTNYSNFNGESLTLKTVTVINQLDGYRFTVPSRWLDRIAVYKDTDKRIRTIFAYDDGQVNTSVRLAQICAVDESQAGSYKEWIKLGEKDDTVFFGKIAENGDYRCITVEELKGIFSITK